MITCQNKKRQPGYWHTGAQVIDSGEFAAMPAIVKTWVPDTSSQLCRHDRKAVTPECVGCKFPLDIDYLKRNGLWIEGTAYGVTE